MHLYQSGVITVIIPQTQSYCEFGKSTFVVKDGWEMKHCDLEIQGQLGKGHFGDVMLGFLTSTSCTDRVKSYTDRMVMQGDSLHTSKTVAVKYLRSEN